MRGRLSEIFGVAVEILVGVEAIGVVHKRDFLPVVGGDVEHSPMRKRHPHLDLQ